MMDDLCGRFAAVRYTWPGKDEAYACIEHAQQLAGIANAMGLHLQMRTVALPASLEEHARCTQHVGRQAASDVHAQCCSSAKS
jgi:hypothetical protein